MKKLLQEFRDLERFKDCLEEDLYQIYKEYLCKKILKEITIKGLANSFKLIFRKNVKQGTKATIDEINKIKKATLNTRYQTSFGKIIKDGRTNLETKVEEYCNKDTFIKEFKKENFDELKDKEDLAIEDTVNTFLTEYLKLYDESGWLILDDYEKTKDAETLNSIS